MSLFFRHEWDMENRELTLYINPTEAFYEFAVEFARQEEGEEHSARRGNLLASARLYATKNLPPNTDIKSYRVKFQQFLIAIVKEKRKVHDHSRQDIDKECGFYTVRPNDTLKDIARDLHINEATLKKENSIASDTLFVGLELKVPVYVHTVVTSDSLHKVAQRYDTSKEAIRKMNKLQTDCLCPGQQLKIPKSL